MAHVAFDKKIIVVTSGGLGGMTRPPNYENIVVLQGKHWLCRAGFSPKWAIFTVFESP